MFRIALATLPFPATPEASVELAAQAIAEAGRAGAELVCLPEAYVPGYRLGSRRVAPPDPAFLERAWSRLAAAAGEAGVGAIVGTERVVDGGLRLSALVIGRDGRRLGFQDKVQLDPSEEATYAAGTARQVFQAGPATFGIAICHEGWRYPETFRWAARRGAQVLFHPHFHESGPRGMFHEHAMQVRAAENTCWVASVNCAGPDAPTVSCVVAPDGTLHAAQPRGAAGLLLADLDLAAATRLLATRWKPTEAA